MKPITPKQVKENIELPEIAIAIVNKLITQNFKGIESILHNVVGMLKKLKQDSFLLNY